MQITVNYSDAHYRDLKNIATIAGVEPAEIIHTAVINYLDNVKHALSTG